MAKKSTKNRRTKCAPADPAIREPEIPRNPDGTFPQGFSGNPSGRPRTAALSQAYRSALEAPYPGDEKGRSYAQVIAERMVEEAGARYLVGGPGRVPAAKELADRTEGKAAQPVEVTTDGGPTADGMAAFLASRGVQLVVKR